MAGGRMRSGLKEMNSGHYDRVCPPPHPAVESLDKHVLELR